MIKRSLKFSKKPEESFFLWGPRQTGKSTLLKELFLNEFYIDLLKTDEFIKYTKAPHLLREELEKKKDVDFVIIDEIQKVPLLLDEVHWLIENKKIAFCLCGSSARKLKKGHSNLLGGRAIRYELFGFTAKELKNEFNLKRILNHGYLPRHYLSNSPKRLLQSYINDYLKEEIREEGLVRSLPAFSNFLESAALGDAELVNFSTIARDCGISPPVVKEYYQILVDTLQGRFLHSHTKRPKRRVIQAPKFYFFDVGVVNFLAKRNELEPGSMLFGKAFENWVYHELCAYIEYTEKFHDIKYWRLASGIEVDFIIGNMDFAIEAKATMKVTSDHLKGLRNIIQDHNQIKKRILVSLEKTSRITNDKIEILSYKDFVDELWKGSLIK